MAEFYNVEPRLCRLFMRYPHMFSFYTLQTIESMKNLTDVKRILKDLCNELQEERRGMNELQQQFARAKAAWEMERTELKVSLVLHDLKQ